MLNLFILWSEFPPGVSVQKTTTDVKSMHIGSDSMDSIFFGNLRVNVATTHRSQKRDAKRNREAGLSHR